jgi:hypothetical protein
MQIGEENAAMMVRNVKYPMLSTVANLLIGAGWMLVVVGAIAFLYGLLTLGKGTTGILMLGSGLGVAVCGLLGTAAGELVGVTFDIECNTRTVTTSGRGPDATS